MVNPALWRRVHFQSHIHPKVNLTPPRRQQQSRRQPPLPPRRHSQSSCVSPLQTTGLAACGEIRTTAQSLQTIDHGTMETELVA